MHPSCAERYRHVILALAFLAVFIGSIPAFSVGTLAPLLRAALHLTREQLGWLTALFYAGTALVCIPTGWIVDRFGARFPLDVHVINSLPVMPGTAYTAWVDSKPVQMVWGVD